MNTIRDRMNTIRDRMNTIRGNYGEGRDEYGNRFVVFKHVKPYLLDTIKEDMAMQFGGLGCIKNVEELR